MYKYFYVYLHIPTNTIYYGNSNFNSDMEFLRTLSDWNRTGQGVWQYWEDSKMKRNSYA